jgi:hypothetical protein
MYSIHIRPVARRALLAALGMMLVAGIAGCSKTQPPAAPVIPAATTAKQDLPAAVAALATIAPDAKLLIVTASSVITSSTPPQWQYLFGVPKTGATYFVAVKNGKGTASKYGSANLSKNEWAQIPPISAWKIDSDAAYSKARSVYLDSTKDTAYILGFVTYVPKAAKGVKSSSMTWSVTFDPASRAGAPTSTVEVNAATGATAFAK